MTSQQQADELLREWQERRAHRIAPQCRSDTKGGKINHGGAIIRSAEPGFVLFVYLVALREELRVRAKSLPRYVERNPRNGRLSFRVDRGARIPLPSDPTSPQFRAAYSRALVEAAATESDADDWSELERFHAAQRVERARGVAR
ncbi:hypothetical protein [Bradyrhizobium uaiense]|uniref:Uncharacterized protein n=1 Tax=Bradyrhizobium uaiense TaxID=2594946 RepID=A0A6P1BB99_9BRAD|nr:hypothetical protein [Bradyrhizobium uaiense]NEU95658.1 hypothetical protein [Bradyrhizobium uaiense]